MHLFQASHLSLLVTDHALKLVKHTLKHHRKAIILAANIPYRTLYSNHVDFLEQRLQWLAVIY